MKLTHCDHESNAADWVGASQDLSHDEIVDREQLAEQMQYTEADAEDIEAIASEIERICKERF